MIKVWALVVIFGTDFSIIPFTDERACRHAIDGLQIDLAQEREVGRHVADEDEVEACQAEPPTRIHRLRVGAEGVEQRPLLDVYVVARLDSSHHIAEAREAEIDLRGRR